MRLVDADAFDKRCRIAGGMAEGDMSEDFQDGVLAVLELLKTQPTIEPSKGKWINRSLNILYPEWELYTCSVCGKHSNSYNFCPHCGADMRGEDDE